MVRLPEPKYGTDGTFVWITFKRPGYVTNPVTQTLHETTDSEESGQKNGQKNSQSTLEQIYILIKNNPSITRKQLVEATGKASSYIQRCINQLKETKRIQRVGPDKGGFWEIIE
jgi:ATP-dependent DNA helicase RecG